MGRFCSYKEKNIFKKGPRYMKKRGLIFITTISIFASSLTAFAYQLPHAFWAMADRYEKAQISGDKYDLISAGSDIVALLENEEKTEQVNTIIASKLYDMGYAYEELGGIENHIKAGECFEKYIPYGTFMGWSDGVKIARQKAKQFKPQLKLYSPTTETQSYFSAPNEPEKGVLYGQVSEEYQSNESMILMYLEYGQSTDFTWPEHIFKKAREEKNAVELALNFPQEGAQLSSIVNDTYYINSLSDMLGKYTDIPIFLRIGAEVNIWQNKADKDLYIQAFRKIANATRNIGSNIATVYSVVHTSEWSIDFDDYYPGDEYVDWIGVSAYANRYFGAKEWPVSESHNPIVYKAGDAADPVILISDVVERYGDRKPIMLAECGSAYYTRGEINSYHTDWAVTSLKRMYSMIPIVYPQVKLIAYFNKNISYENNYYDLEGCFELKNAYNEATKAPWFIQNSYQNKVEYAYEEINDTIIANSKTLTLYAYPHIYGDDLPKVNYYIDGEWAASVSDLPYEKTLDISALPSGTHTLTAEVESNGMAIISRNFTLNISGTCASEEDSLSTLQKQALDFCKAKGVISGYEDGTIRPFNNITRAEFATMTARLFNLSSDYNCTFFDAASHWASKYIRACVDKGAISGIGDNCFAPDNNVTYEQAVKIITSICGLCDGVDLDALGGYPDAYIWVARDYNILDNVEGFSIGSPINRVNVAVLFYNSQNLK